LAEFRGLSGAKACAGFSGLSGAYRLAGLKILSSRSYRSEKFGSAKEGVTKQTVKPFD
jgi:hypothetical protein